MNKAENKQGRESIFIEGSTESMYTGLILFKWKRLVGADQRKNQIVLDFVWDLRTYIVLGSIKWLIYLHKLCETYWDK